MYKLSIEINKKVQKVEGKTIMSCLKKLKKQPFYKTKGYLYITKGKIKATYLLTPFRCKRLFEGADMIKLAMSKNLSILLGE